MRRQYIYLILMLSLGISVFSQKRTNGSRAIAESNLSVFGKVIDESGDAIPYASIAVYSSSTLKLVKGSISDLDGKFRIPLPNGQYYAIFSFLSYKDKKIEGIIINDRGYSLKQVVLALNTEQLNEVQVIAEKSTVEMKLDKMIFNVGKDMTNQGGSAADILDNIPSVQVDVEGNVSLRGSQNVRILVNGKQSGLIGISSLDGLRMMQGEMIEKVEVITNPSAKYDAEGEAGIINIVLKKEKQKGFNGSFSANVGYPSNYGLSYSINLRRDWINLFSSYGLRYRRNPGGGSSHQEFFGDTIAIYDQTRKHIRGGFGQNFRLGSDFMLNDQNTLTISGLYKDSKNDNIASVIYSDYENNQLTREITRVDDELELEQTIEVTLGYKKEFDKKGHQLTFDANYTNGEDLETSEIEETSSISDVFPINQRYSNTENQENYLVQTDYVFPFFKDGKLELGAKVTNREINNKYKVEQEYSSNSNSYEWRILDDFNNHMQYIEEIRSAYALAGNKSGNFSYQGGIRYEETILTTNLKKTQEVNKRSFQNIFPSIHTSYELKKDNFIQLSYSKRINRPRFWWLLPFFTFSDTRNLSTGNPNLNPEFTDSYELGYLKKWENANLLSSLFYRYSTNVIERVTLEGNSPGTTIRYPINLSNQNAFGLEISGSSELTKNWNVNGNFSYFRSIREGEYQGVNYNADTWQWTTRMTSKWTIKKKYNVQTTVDYRSPKNTTQGRALAMYSINPAGSMDVLNGNGTFTLTINDLLNSRKRRSITETESFVMESNFQWRSRTVILTFNYRLNQKKRRPNRSSGNFDMDM